VQLAIGWKGLIRYPVAKSHWVRWCPTYLGNSHGANETGSSRPQRLFARSRNNLSGGYTSHDFVTARAWCAITTALQPSTSIYRGLVVVPKVESSLSLNPLSLISTYLSVGVSVGTHPPPFQEAFLKHFTTTQTTVFKAPSVGITSSPRFYPC